VLLIIYVDDGLIFADDRAARNILENLKNCYDVHEENSNVFLGFQIKKNSKFSHSLYQEGYIQKILKKYNMHNARSIDNPSSTARNTHAEITGEKIGPGSVPISCVYDIVT